MAAFRLKSDDFVKLKYILGNLRSARTEYAPSQQRSLQTAIGGTDKHNNERDVDAEASPDRPVRRPPGRTRVDRDPGLGVYHAEERDVRD